AVAFSWWNASRLSRSETAVVRAQPEGIMGTSCNLAVVVAVGQEAVGPVALEAAHIKWHQAGGPDTEINGLALCSLHHKLFDRGAFTLSDNLEIMVSDRANGREGFREWLLRFHGTRIHSPQRATYVPNSDFRIWHVREVFKGSFRDASS
ncbi:MAG: HNH endonuclease, partial [Thermodesulfobacteriota bacterium]